MKQRLLNTLQKILAACARYYISRTKPIIVGITGSVGKTSCRMIISQILQQYIPEKKVSTSKKNFNSELGVVFSIFEINEYTPGIGNLLKVAIKIFFLSIFSIKKYDYIVLEYGIDHPGDMDFLLDIAVPDYAIFTKLDTIHGVYFDTKNGIGDEKIKLINAAKQKAFLNPKDEFMRKIYKDIRVKKSFFTVLTSYKLQSKENNIYSQIKFSDKTVNTNLVGEENAEYIALGFDLLQEIGVTVKNKNISLKLELQPGRFSFFEGIGDSILIDSSYNAGPESMKKMIENTFFFRDQLFSEYKVLLCLGEMRELGDITKEEHLGLLSYVQKADAMVTVGSDINYLVDELYNQGYKRELKNYKKSRDAGKYIREYLDNTDDKYIVLFKGSQNTIFTEEALKEVLKNHTDENKLVRQSEDWLQKKDKFFY